MYSFRPSEIGFSIQHFSIFECIITAVVIFALQEARILLEGYIWVGGNELRLYRENGFPIHYVSRLGGVAWQILLQ